MFNKSHIAALDAIESLSSLFAINDHNYLHVSYSHLNKTYTLNCPGINGELSGVSLEQVLIRAYGELEELAEEKRLQFPGVMKNAAAEFKKCKWKLLC